jgi:nucleotide-binding universal stress UspA family protein
MFKHLLVPVDDDELSHTVLAPACEFARQIGARLTFYHAIPSYFPTTLAGEAMFDDVTTYETFHAAMAQRAAQLLREAEQVASDAGVACSTLRDECDTPWEGIVAAAVSQSCDLIFMASHGRHGASALLLGSESKKVVSHSKLPVLLYR